MRTINRNKGLKIPLSSPDSFIFILFCLKNKGKVRRSVAGLSPVGGTQESFIR